MSCGELAKHFRAYLALGFSVIPVAYNRKAPPLVKWEEFMMRQPTLADFEDWLKGFTRFNLAVVTGRVSRLMVIDFDDEDLFEDWIAELPIRYKMVVWNYTVKVRTPRGVHVYVRPEHDSIIPRTKKGYTEGVDVKGDGGYVVAPPSTVDGKRYAFFRGDGAKVFSRYLPPLWTETVSYLLDSVKRVV